MKASVMGKGYAQFMQYRGRRIMEAAGALWFNTTENGRFYMSVPDQLQLDPEPGEVAQMLRSVNGMAVRFPTAGRAALDGGLYVCRNRKYDLTSVHPKQRSCVRRGLERCAIRQVETSELLSQGLELNLDTMKRQHRFHPEYGNAAQWKRFVEAVSKSAAIRATGAFIDGRLAAYVITCHEDGWVHHLEQMSRIEDLGKFPNHALTFRVIQDAMQDPNVLAVCNGPAALVGNKGLDTYKLQLGYEKLPQSVAYQFHPAVAPVLTNSITLRLLRSGGQRWERVSAVLHGARMFRTEAQHHGI